MSEIQEILMDLAETCRLKEQFARKRVEAQGSLLKAEHLAGQAEAFGFVAGLIQRESLKHMQEESE